MGERVRSKFPAGLRQYIPRRARRTTDMRKWLAALGALLLVALVLLWRELDSSSAASPPGLAATAPIRTVPAGSESARGRPEAGPASAAPAPGPVPDRPAKTADKMDPQGDEFFYKHDEIVIPMMMRQAVKCWENLSEARRAEFHRNQNLVAKFKQRIRG